MERVQKIIAQAGIASRRKAEVLIAQGKVAVNGITVSLGGQADPHKDKITVNGEEVHLQKKVYIMLNKPQGYVTTVYEHHGMKTVMDIVKVNCRIFPVGRLDKETEGLLFLTNDGDFANRLTHPRYEVEKEYIVILSKSLSKEDGEKLKKGIIVEGRLLTIRKMQLTRKEVVLTIHEGRKHIVRKLFAQLGYKVLRLKRTIVGKIELGELAEGKWRFLTMKEVQQLTQLSH